MTIRRYTGSENPQSKDLQVRRTIWDITICLKNRTMNRQQSGIENPQSKETQLGRSSWGTSMNMDTVFPRTGKQLKDCIKRQTKMEKADLKQRNSVAFQ